MCAGTERKGNAPHELPGDQEGPQEEGSKARAESRLRDPLGFALQLTQAQVVRGSAGPRGEWAPGSSWRVVAEVKEQSELFSLPQEDRD